MAPPRTLLIVLAGGAGARLGSVADAAAASALRFAGSHRLIDFPLSHARNSGIADVWVLERHHAITAHLAGGRPWDLDRTRGGLVVRGLGEVADGAAAGSADALWAQVDAIGAYEPEVVLVAPADAIYRMDYSAVAAEHLRIGAAATVVTTRYDGDRSRHGVVVVREGRVTHYAHRPRVARTDVIATGVLAFEPRELLARLTSLHRERAGDGALGDIGERLMPGVADAGDAVELRHTGYWRDVGTVAEYWRAHMDLLSRPPFDLDDPAWPISTRQLRHAAARLTAGAEVDRALVSAGAVVEGTVRRSVLGPGVHVSPGAVVSDAVLLDDVRIGPGAQVHRAVVDEGARVRGRAEVGAAAPTGPAAEAGAGVEAGAAVGTGAAVGDGEIALVGARAVVHPRKRVPPGGRYGAR
ncbi:sugar phosphate nucleotidyltransferase [Georgenia yuyongxinii]|nr:sugar phosphate nucleotidyltransferase [Georgenia yuyongxinii]